MKRLRLAGIGCGGRTLTYLSLAAKQMGDRFEIVAAADPIRARAEKVRPYAGKDFRLFNGDRSFFEAEKMADVVVIGTQDYYHVAPCIAAMEKGYDVLLEKPIARDPSEVLRLEQTARRLGRKVLVCHVLRYAPLYQKIRQLVSTGVLGRVMSLHASEGVGPFHQAHSYVRGHWSVTDKTNPMIVAKSCHDMDIIHWLLGEPCQSVSSYGALSFFKQENAPPGAPLRCTNGCIYSGECPYNARLYATKHRKWLSYVYDDEKNAPASRIFEWLSKSPWGRCVYQCDNTAVDHQVVNMNFKRDITASFTMTAFDSGRNIDIFGSNAVLRGGSFVKKATGHDIMVEQHNTDESCGYDVDEEAGGYDGHGGGDAGLVRALYDEMSRDRPEDMRSSITRSVESHLMAFAAETSRISGETVDLADYRRQLEGKIKQ